jgi:hypothetical protein
MKTMTRIGAGLFVAWGLFHILGGIAILASAAESVEAGYATYANSDGSYNELSGAILGYFAYLLIVAGGVAAFVGAKLNWKNSRNGLAFNTVFVGLVEIGLVWFLVMPGFVSWGEASVGLVPFVLATIISGVACQSAHGRAAASVA